MDEVSKKPTVNGMKERIKKYLSNHPTNTLYGNLKVFLGQNTSESIIRSTFEHCIELNDREGAEICIVLLTMSKTQRLKISHVD